MSIANGRRAQPLLMLPVGPYRNSADFKLLSFTLRRLIRNDTWSEAKFIVVTVG